MTTIETMEETTTETAIALKAFYAHSLGAFLIQQDGRFDVLYEDAPGHWRIYPLTFERIPAVMDSISELPQTAIHFLNEHYSYQPLNIEGVSTELDGRIWEFKVTQADDPEGNSEDYYMLYELERLASKQPGDVYRFAQSMRPGDIFTYTSEQALCTFRVKCSDGKD